MWDEKEILRRCNSFAHCVARRWRLPFDMTEDLSQELATRILSLPEDKASWEYAGSCMKSWASVWIKENAFAVRYPGSYRKGILTSMLPEPRDHLFSTLPAPSYHNYDKEEAKRRLSKLPVLIGGPLIDYLNDMTPQEIGMKWGVSPQLVFQRINRFDKLVERTDVWQLRSEQTKSTIATSSPISAERTSSAKVMTAGR